ncbi:hypothetical protein K470DRAFT_37163 [Piedraia hortae CBS 480.64]|uniref:RRM domain-containing protein n=1 Tax=Piedraia hortae CBS 480.64 TaxID=1314780 RepID=A0A6A7C3G4_9PEZI|nr:hypothetical protein K470DRAFT_37163 [Piedraia hortae CBS 480.64]
MSEEDTFEIDIYGDQPEPDQPQPGNNAEGLQQNVHSESEPTGDSNLLQVGGHQEADASVGGSGTKRKAPPEEPYGDNEEEYDDRPVDPSAFPALKVCELHWATSEDDLRAICASVKAEAELIDLSFGEHKINGKSKGEAYLEFTSVQASTAVKREIDARSEQKEGAPARQTPFTANFAPVGNPYKSAAGGTRKDWGGNTMMQNNVSRGGGYGRGGFANQRGGFVPRGGAAFNNPMMQRNQQQQGWGNFAAFNNPMMMMGYNNMRGGMVNGMGMGMMRGGFNPMANMRGNMGMNRGGWNGNYGGFTGSEYVNSAGNGNKRPKMD